MSSNRKDSFSEAIVGVFMLAVLALLVYFTIIVSGVDVFGNRKMVSVDVAFEDVGGLKEHDHVMTTSCIAVRRWVALSALFLVKRCSRLGLRLIVT